MGRGNGRSHYSPAHSFLFSSSSSASSVIYQRHEATERTLAPWRPKKLDLHPVFDKLSTCTHSRDVFRSPDSPQFQQVSLYVQDEWR